MSKEIDVPMLEKFSSNMINLVKHNTNNIKFAVAVSGGADSMCMLDLAKRWALEVGAQIIPITVNHKLRDVEHEIQMVQKYCTKNNLKLHVLTAQHNNEIKSNIQARAREIRYELISKFCENNDIFYVMVAHHIDDAAENILMKMYRRSGLLGLSNNAISLIKNVVIIRPILNFTKKNCVEYLQTKSITWTEDPTNSNTNFTRNYIRQVLQKFDSKLEDFNKSVFDTINNLGYAQHIVQNRLVDAYSKSTIFSCFGYGMIKLDILHNYEEPIQNMVLYYCISQIFSRNRYPKMKQIKYLWKQIASKKITTSTIHGCKICVIKNKFIFVYRLFGLNKPESVKLTKNSEYDLIWDNRWKIDIQYYSENSGVSEKIAKIMITYLSNNVVKEWSETTIKAILAIEQNSFLKQVPEKELRDFLLSMPVLKLEEQITFACVEGEKIIFDLHNENVKISCRIFYQLKPQSLNNPFSVSSDLFDF